MSCEWVSYTGSNQGFWSHEWSKHGTCTLPLFPSQQDYFNSAIQLNNQFEPNDALEQAGIDPGTVGSVTIPQLQSAFKSAWGVTPLITCYSGDVFELQLCLTPDLKAMDCPSNLRYSKCPSTSALPQGSAGIPPVCTQYYSGGGGSGGGGTSSSPLPPSSPGTGTNSGGTKPSSDATPSLSSWHRLMMTVLYLGVFLFVQTLMLQ